MIQYFYEEKKNYTLIATQLAAHTLSVPMILIGVVTGLYRIGILKILTIIL